MPENFEEKLRKGEQLKAGRDFDTTDTSQDDRSGTVIIPQPSLQSQGGNISRELNPGTTFGTNYQIVKLVGKGGMSAVYQAYDKMLKRNVAIKVLSYKRKLDKKARARFVQEGIALSKLDHPNLIKVYEFGDADSAEPFLVMDFLEGCALSDVMEPKKALPALRAVSIIRQCVQALRHAHNKGVVHRDLKPSNIMLVENKDTGEEVVKIIDFGIAKVDEADSQRLTETGEVFGSPLYMSPEQCRGEKLDERSDMYSLGCMFFELLTGKAPFVGVDFADTVGMHFNEDPKPLTELRPDLSCAKDLDIIINKLMAKARKDRYQTMDEVSEDLEQIYDFLKGAYREQRANLSANRLPVSDVDAAVAERQQANAASEKSGERKKVADTLQEKTNPGDNKKLDKTIQEESKDGQKPFSKRKVLAAVALLLLVAFTAKEAFDIYAGMKKHPWEKAEPLSISDISQSSKELAWWQEDMDTADRLFNRGKYTSAYEHYRKALKIADSIKDDNRSLIMGTTLEHMIDLCYVIKVLNNGKASSSEDFQDNSHEYREALQKLQPTPSRDELNAELTKLINSEGPDTTNSDSLDEDQKTATVKIAAIATDLALTSTDKNEALKFFDQANLHIRMLMRNRVPDFAELLMKQSQYLAGVGETEKALILLQNTSKALSSETGSLARDRATLEYAQGCLNWQLSASKDADEIIHKSAMDAMQSGPETFRVLTSATDNLIRKHLAESNKEINSLLLTLNNQLPRQYWAIAQSLRLSSETDLASIQNLLTFTREQAPGASEDINKATNNAVAKLKRAIAILERSRPYDRRDISSCYQDLSEIYLATRRYDDLENLIPTVLAQAQQMPDFNPIERAALTHNLGFLKQRKKQYAEAERLYREAIALIGAQGTTTGNISSAVLKDFNSLMKETGRESEKLDVIPVVDK